MGVAMRTSIHQRFKATKRRIEDSTGALTRLRPTWVACWRQREPCNQMLQRLYRLQVIETRVST